MLALPCCHRGDSVDWGGEGTEGASATGSEELPPAASAAAQGGRGRKQSISATDLVAFGCGRLQPLGGDRRRGSARLLKAAEMRLRISGTDAGVGAGCSPWGGGVPLRRRRPRGAGGDSGARGHRPRVVVRPCR